MSQAYGAPKSDHSWTEKANCSYMCMCTNLLMHAQQVDSSLTNNQALIR